MASKSIKTNLKSKFKNLDLKTMIKFLKKIKIEKFRIKLNFKKKV